MFDIQPGNKYQLRDFLSIKEQAIEEANGRFGKQAAAEYISKLRDQIPNGIVTIKEEHKTKILINEGRDLYIYEWMIKEYIAGGR